jgi:hypothetical protein
VHTTQVYSEMDRSQDGKLQTVKYETSAHVTVLFLKAHSQERLAQMNTPTQRSRRLRFATHTEHKSFSPVMVL